MKTAQTEPPKTPSGLLLHAPPGSGKTTILLQFPGIWIADCDQNLKGPKQYLERTTKKPVEFFYDVVDYDDAGVAVPPERRWHRYLALLDAAAKDPRVKVLGTDALTRVDGYIRDYVMGAKAEMDVSKWVGFKKAALDWLFNKLKSYGKPYVVTAHEAIIYESGSIAPVVSKYEPYFSGAVSDFLGCAFTDVWRAELRPAGPGLLKQYIRTIRDPRLDLKCSFELSKDFSTNGEVSGSDNITKLINAFLA
jgi:hypothetical protein